MGLQIREIIPAREISLAELKGRTLAIDSYNMLYQFLTTIRQRDGTPLMDSNGRVTSHLVGLFSRTTNFLNEGLKPVFVFDGRPPILKQKENERRKEAKQLAKEQFEAAKQAEDLAGMKKFAGRTSKLDKEMVEEAKNLVRALGCPVVEAPSEGEAQAAHMARKGDAYAVVSQDYDSLLYDAPHLVRNLSVAGKRKIPGKPVWQNVSPEIIEVRQALKELGISDEQLLCLAILIGTDYNIGGIKGIGPKKALGLVKEHKIPERVFAHVEWPFEYPWQEVHDTFRNMPVNDDYSLRWANPDKERLVKLLCEGHDFSQDRVESGIAGLAKKQKGLGDFF
jgi:flap endonuclease-1